ncbi:MAG: hypothetical protein IJ853_00890 [Rickettsiales bacterium]|nr:hypothetical protein [Rickettsiales bacterium]
MRVAPCFNSSRKVVKVHQNILIFVKGNAKQATERLGDVKIKEIEELLEEQQE